MHASVVFWGIFLSCPLIFGVWACLTSRWKIDEDFELNAVIQVFSAALIVMVVGLLAVGVARLIGEKAFEYCALGGALGGLIVALVTGFVPLGKIAWGAITWNFSFRIVTNDQCSELLGPVAIIAILGLTGALFATAIH